MIHIDGLKEEKEDVEEEEKEEVMEPNHYGTEDSTSFSESADGAAAAGVGAGLGGKGLPERFQPFVRQLRGLVFRPPKDWKYQVCDERRAEYSLNTA